MGLDMYAYTTDEIPNSPVDFEVNEENREDLDYWRKHPNLHGWMRDLYFDKGGIDPEFNCVNLQLTAEDLDKLESDIKDDLLPPTEGFFFGVSDKETIFDLEFIKNARLALKEGKTVYYTAWY